MAMTMSLKLTCVATALFCLFAPAIGGKKFEKKSDYVPREACQPTKDTAGHRKKIFSICEGEADESREGAEDLKKTSTTKYFQRATEEGRRAAPEVLRAAAEALRKRAEYLKTQVK